jgi:hypothetical protein
MGRARLPFVFDVLCVWRWLACGAVGIVQRFLCVQLLVPIGSPCSFELGVSDSSGNRRRILLSSAFRGLERTPLHGKVPLDGGHALVRGCWTNLCLDVEGLVSLCFPGCEFRSLDHVVLGAECRVRNVFSLRRAPLGSDLVKYPGNRVAVGQPAVGAWL